MPTKHVCVCVFLNVLRTCLCPAVGSVFDTKRAAVLTKALHGRLSSGLLDSNVFHEGVMFGRAATCLS